MPVAVGVDGVGHPGVGGAVRQQRLRQADDVRRLRARQGHGAGLHGLGPLRFAPQHEHGLAEGRGLLLDAAGVRHHQVAARHQPVHVHGVQRLDEGDVGHAAQQPPGALAHGRAQVDGVDYEHLRVPLGDLAHGGEDVFHRPAVILPPVAGEGDHAPAGEVERAQLRRAEALAAGGVGQRVYHRVAGDENAALHTLAAQVLRVARGGGEVQRAKLPRQAAVHLLRVGRPAVEGAQPGLHVAAGYLGVKGGQGGGEGGGRVPMHEHEVRPGGLKNAAEPGEDAGRDVRERLPRAHDVQVVVRRDAKDGEHAVEHLAVLRRHADLGIYVFPPGQFQGQGGHFYRLRPRAEDGEDADLRHRGPPFFRRDGPAGACAPPRRDRRGPRAGGICAP